MQAFVELLRYEWLGLIRSRRALSLALLYLFSTAVAVAAYRSAERGWLQLRGQVSSSLNPQDSSAPDAPSGVGAVLGWYTGHSASDLHPRLSREPLWALLLIFTTQSMPWILLLAGFDQFSQSRRERHYAFYGLRASRWAFF